MFSATFGRSAVFDVKLDDATVFDFYDPCVVEQMKKAAVGAAVTVSLGAKLPMSALAAQPYPLPPTSEVKCYSVSPT